MNRKTFISQVGLGAAALLVPACLGGLQGCKKASDPPTDVNFSLDVSSGDLSQNGGFVIQDGVLVARSVYGTYIAVAAGCTHEGVELQYKADKNVFHCSRHGSEFDMTGNNIHGPAKKDLMEYNTELNGNILRVFS